MRMRAARSLAAVMGGVLAGVLTLSACSEPVGRREPDAPAEADAWMRPPMVESVSLAAESVLVRGRADPRARVVLRLGEDAAYAASADGQGRFEVRAPRPRAPALLEPQAEAGREVARSPERLLLVGDAAVLVAPGEPAHRLDRRQPLQVVDSDDRLLAASGVSTPGATVVVELQGRPPVRVVADAAGRWAATLGPAPDGAVRLSVDARAYVYPGPGAPLADDAKGAPRAERAGLGWRASWSDAGGGTRRLWLPDGG